MKTFKSLEQHSPEFSNFKHNCSMPKDGKNKFIPYLPTSHHANLNRIRKYATFSQNLKFTKGTSHSLPASLSGKLKHTQRCSFDFIKCTTRELAHLSRILSNVKTLSSLTLCLQDCEVVQKNGFCPLFQQLLKLKKASSIKLKFIWCKIRDSELKEFSKALRLQKSMNKLNLSFHGREMFTQRGFSIFTRQLSKYSQLKCLELCMDYFQNINEKKVFELFRAFSKIKKLLNLKIKICHRGVNNACLDHLAESLYKLSNLVDLDLAFQSCSKIDDLGLASVALALSNLKNLHSLCLDFSWCDRISLQGIKSISSALNRFPKLQKLKLDLRGCNKIDDVTLSILWASVSNLKSLTHLNLSLGDGKMISAAGFSYLHNQLPCIGNVTSLKLMFDVCKFMDDSILTSISKVVCSLENLTNLILLVHLGGTVTDAGLLEISKIFNFTKKLKSLRLHFYMYRIISSQGFSYLTQTLPLLQDLENLTINFSWSNVESRGITNLGIALSQIRKIKDLRLSFYACNNIDDHSLKQLIEAISYLDNLRILHLDLGGCKITHRGVIFVADLVTKLKMLKELDLNFSNCKAVGDKGVLYLCNKVKEMKALTSLNLDFESTSSSILSKETLKSLTDALSYLENFSAKASSEDFIC